MDSIHIFCLKIWAYQPQFCGGVPDNKSCMSCKVFVNELPLDYFFFKFIANGL